MIIRFVEPPPNKLPPLASGLSSWNSKIRFLTPNRSSWVLHVPRFCVSPRSFSKQTIFEEFWKTRPAEQHSLVLFGKNVLENRYSAMYATTKSVGNYTYSGSSRSCKVCNVGQPHEKFVLDLCASADGIATQLRAGIESENENEHNIKIKDSTEGLPPPPSTPIYNACLVNWYTPEHTIGLHSDDEPELDTSWPILSISWGGPRRFLLRSKTDTRMRNKSCTTPSQQQQSPLPKAVHEFVLGDGDLLVMGGKCQDEFKHEIPRVRSTKDGLVGNRISWTIRRMKPKPKPKVVKKATHTTTSCGREAGNNRRCQDRSCSGTTKTKRTNQELSESKSHPRPLVVTHDPSKPRKKAAIYNPYARNRAGE